MRPFHQVYRELLSELLENGITELNQRTGVKVKVLRGGTAFPIDLRDDVLPTIGCRKTFPKSAAAEVAWFLQGNQDVSFIRKYAPLWDKFTEADGTTVEAAYGWRWRNHFSRDQLMDGVEALKKDPSSRRVYISAWDPSTDGLLMQNQKNVPCPVGFSLNILAGELHSSLFLRSSDVFVGLPYDVMGHALLMSILAEELDVRLGTMHVTLGHAHLYQNHWDLALGALGQAPVVPGLLVPVWSIAEVLVDPDGFVEHVAEEARAHEWPSFNPKPFVVE